MGKMSQTFNLSSTRLAINDSKSERAASQAGRRSDRLSVATMSVSFPECRAFYFFLTL
jgi:hypothetical protein